MIKIDCLELIVRGRKTIYSSWYATLAHIIKRDLGCTEMNRFTLNWIKHGKI